MTSTTTPASAAATTADQFIQGIGPAAAISPVVGSMSPRPRRRVTT